jgi:hypothetical protein
MQLTRQERIALLEAIEQRVKQFHRDDDIWPFRRPHEPLDLSGLVTFTLGHPSVSSAVDALRSRTVMEMQWPEGEKWEAWAATLASGIHVYFDSGGAEHRLLASVKRGSAVEADRFFLELLAESRGAHFGIEMRGGAPARVRTPIDDRALLTDVIVDLFEDTDAEADVREAVREPASDFRDAVDVWLSSVLVAPAASPRSKRYPRLREEDLGFSR